MTKSETLSNLLGATAIGVLQLGVAISLAALIFSGPLTEGTGRAAAGFVLGTLIVSAIVGATSSMSVVIAGTQDTAAVLIAAAAAAVVAAPGISTSELVPTVVVMVAIATVATGITFWVLGRYQLTTFVRFLPFPVISGFTAGTGWLLMRGGLEVMHRRQLAWSELGDLVSWQQAKFLVPGLALAAVMLITVLTDRLPNTLVSLAILGGTVLFHIVGRSTSTFAALESQGWFIGPFAEGAGWSPLRPDDFANTNWTALLDNGLLIVAVVAVSVIGLLLNLSGLESGPDTRIEMNGEMQSAGAANLLVGLGGGMVGYHLLGDILLARQIGARGRVVPLSIAGLAAAVFIAGVDLIALVPRSIAGGVLTGLGITVLATWAMSSLPRMNRTDQVLSALILVTIATFGVLAGVGAGVAIAALVFTIKYSRINPVRHVIDAAGRSTIDRDEREKQTLAETSNAILAFELQGYLFFGSTTQLRRQIDDTVTMGAGAEATKYVIIDFGHVTGIDSTAASGLKTIASQLAGENVMTLWSGARPEIARELERDRLDMAGSHTDLDHAISWAENEVILTMTSFMFDGATPPPFSKQLMEILNMPRLEIAAGETLISEGATDTDVYFVESGRLSAWLAAPPSSDRPAGTEIVRVRQVLPGAVLGEVSFCTGTPRSATVVADTDATVLVLRRQRFDQVSRSHPEAALAIQKDLLNRMGMRVSSTSAMIRDLLR